MNPDAVSAIDALRARGSIDTLTAARLRRAESGELVSVRDELRVLLWAGVFLATTGVGLLVHAEIDRIGPIVVASVLAAASAGCLIWAWRRTAARSFAFESVLLLGALVGAADLAYVEVKFTPLGQHWPLHLLIVAAAYGALAVRFDAPSLFSLALTSFAAWRGVSVGRIVYREGAAPDAERFVFEACLCGGLFILLGRVLESRRIKPGFEPAATWLGWLLLLGALGTRVLDPSAVPWTYATVMAACGGLLAWFAWEERILSRFAAGVAAMAVAIGGVGMSLIEHAQAGEAIGLLFILVLASAVIVLVTRAHRVLRGPA